MFCEGGDLRNICGVGSAISRLGISTQPPVMPVQPIYESQTFTLITSLLIAATIVAPLAAYLGGQLKEVLCEVSAFDGEGAAQVSAAFLLALLATLGYGADSVAPPVWVGALCVGIAYSPVAWLAVRAVRGCRLAPVVRRQQAAL